MLVLHQNPVCTSSLLCTCHMSYPSHSCWFIIRNCNYFIVHYISACLLYCDVCVVSRLYLGHFSFCVHGLYLCLGFVCMSHYESYMLCFWSYFGLILTSSISCSSEWTVVDCAECE
jgi:hypothetical protein